MPIRLSYKVYVYYFRRVQKEDREPLQEDYNTYKVGNSVPVPLSNIQLCSVIYCMVIV